jgi:hypothetical protein
MGVALDRVVLSHGSQAVAQHSPDTALDTSQEGFQEDLQHDLGLSNAQAAQVFGILNRHQTAVNDAWHAVHSRLDAAIDSVHAEIAEVLDSEQQMQLHEWLLARHGISDARRVGEGH